MRLGDKDQKAPERAGVSGPMDRIAGFLSRFAGDERGVTAVIFGIISTALFLTAAIALDFSRASTEQSRVQWALDAAALAASNYLGLEDEDVSGSAAANAFYKANMGANEEGTVQVDLDGAAGTVMATTSRDFGMTLLKAVPKEEWRRQSTRVGAQAAVVKGSGTIEVVMALDTSGSMRGSKIDTLKTAANNLIGIVFAGAEGTSDVKVGVVPFAASVNVGAGNAGSGWIYQGAESALPWPLFQGSSSRFDILSQMNRSWRGCVEARVAPNDVNDAVPDEDDVNTMFVPMFAPDEPDDDNANAAGYSRSGNDSNGYPNNYISDFYGTCPAPAMTCVAYKTVGGKKSCKTWRPTPIGIEAAQTRSCKYQGATPGAPEGSAPGPNSLCTTPPILPLTSVRADVEDAIMSLVADGITNISEGTAWAWRVISPGLPFTEGRDYADPENRKVMIVMTDGDNYLQSKTQHNKSVYAAYGYGSQNRLGTAYTQSSYTTQINAKTIAACNAAKATGIKVFTVAFGTDISSTGLNLLRQCATTPDEAYIASDESALIQAFQNIGREIAKLRVSS
mgnify:CR=1 FL=1